MKVILNNIEITCTVEEFEELYVRGIFGKTIEPERFDLSDTLKPYTPPTKPYDTVTLLYGCTMENNHLYDQNPTITTASSDIEAKKERR